MILTQRQQEVLDYISHMQATAGVMPSTREIQEHFGFASQTAAVNHLRALEKKGMIQRQPGKARAVAVVSQLRRERIVDVPVYGSIAAGFAETTDQQDEGTVSIDVATLGLGRNKRVFALKVRGDSMIGAAINDGDLAILENREPQAGAIVAALIDGETTLKRLVQQRGRYYLRAENPNFPDLMPMAELSVQGVLVALIRKYRN
ncbi:transcriptional repressor, LexA family [Chthoniobacter flavus Ellin428]|uniref:Transcriptional repressor, LexA family n=1 Tax=Chthoniobacter flavus Ellin428 TaxID=497964 RepID=B4D757_9BACT|nr:transcriptional repressor LexA [Chthoniobacter flavus]EDY17708.1 transcriptional repressor, LexA family [Chthoniobacter flavus Ellin428]TCO87033.1 repressor LexA [Chthoniobacter flavus]